MLGVRFRSGCIAAVALLSLATPLIAQGVDIEAAWRRMFARPASPPPAPDDNPLAADRIALGARLFADTRLSGAGDRACATCHRPDRAFTDGRRRALGLSGALLATQHARAVEPGVGQASSSGTGAPPRSRRRSRCRSRRRGEMGGDWPHDSASARRGRRPRRPVPGGARGRAGRIAGGRRRGARRLRALAGVAADPVRCLDRGRQHRRCALPRCAASGCSPARPDACSVTWAGASPTTASTTSAWPAATAAAARCRAARRA